MIESTGVLWTLHPLATGPSVGPGVLAALPFLALWLWCLADVVQTDESLVRGFSKQQWIFMVLLTNVVGGLLWLALGRPYRRDG